MIYSVIVGSKKVVLFECEKPFLSSIGKSQRRNLKYENSPLSTRRDNAQNSLGV